MRLFVYEFITGGGLWESSNAPPSGSLFHEGSAMLRAVAEDFAKLPGVEVVITWDERLPAPPAFCQVRGVGSTQAERSAIKELASASDGVLVIAPELDGALQERVQWVTAAGGALLCPGVEFVSLASDKDRCGRHLQAAGVPTPQGVRLQAGDAFPRDFPYPAVLKPCDGAGSQDLFRVDSVSFPWPAGLRNTAWRLEAFHPGRPASIAVLCGPGGNIILPPCRQVLTDDGHWRYLGGVAPAPAAWTGRATILAKKVIAAMPPTTGYVGIDLILGAASDGSQDAVIEVNPRLTTSYVGLRQIVAGNLAEIMWKTALGIPPAVSYRQRRIEFSAEGTMCAKKR